MAKINRLRKPIHEYVIVNLAERVEIYEKFFKSFEEAQQYLYKHNGKMIGRFKAKLEIRETDNYRKWKKRYDI